MRICLAGRRSSSWRVPKQFRNFARTGKTRTLFRLKYPIPGHDPANRHMSWASLDYQRILIGTISNALPGAPNWAGWRAASLWVAWTRSARAGGSVE
jgi:hypothetical protein